jgi:hypothetical protein
VRKIVLENEDPFTSPLVKRKAGETQLFVKQVKIEGKRYIVCRNEAELKRTARIARRSSLRSTQLKKGDKALVGNSAYRRYLRKREMISPSAPRSATGLNKFAVPKGYRPRGTPDKTRTSHPELDRNHAATTHNYARTSPLMVSMLQSIGQTQAPQVMT